MVIDEVATTSISPPYFEINGAIDRTRRSRRRVQRARRASCASRRGAKEADVLVPQVVWGHFPVGSEGDDARRFRRRRPRERSSPLPFPATAPAPYLCIADFFRPANVPTGLRGFLRDDGSRGLGALSELFAATDTSIIDAARARGRDDRSTR